MNTDQASELRRTLERKARTYELVLTPDTLDRIVVYYELLNSWNSRLHLVAPTSPKEFATRHILESLLLLKHLTPAARVADIGSGAGLPIIPCLIARPDIEAILIESSKKKSVFLREALAQGRGLKGTVLADRFENVPTPDVDFVTCRALERFEKMAPQLVAWAPRKAVLLLFGGEGLAKSLAGSHRSLESTLIPNSERRFLFEVKNRDI